MKKKLLDSYSVCLLLAIIAFTNVQSQTFVFAKLQGSPVDLSGWNPQGACYVGNTPVGAGNTEVILTDPTNGSAGSIFYQTPINLSACRKWYAEFDFRIFDGNQADGLAFCYLDNPPVGAVTGAGLGIPATANGLKICFDTYRNCNTDAMPKIQVRWGTGYTECNGQPTRTNNDGAISFLRSNSYSHCKIEYDQGNISVYVNNVLYLTGFQTFNFPGYFGFTASTGGLTDRHSIKNAIIYTEMPPSFAGPDAVICAKDSAQLGGTFNPAYSYLWTPALGINDATISNPKAGLDNTGITGYTQKYVVQTFFTTNPGCASKDTVEVFVRAKPKAIISPPTETCLGNATQFTDASDGRGSTVTKWNWDFGDGTFSTLQNPAHTYTSTGNFSVKLAIETGVGCRSDTALINIIVNPLPTVAFTFPAAGCNGNIIQFNDASAANTGSIVSRNWNFGDGVTDSVQNPVHRYFTNGNFNVTLLVVTSKGCSNSATKIISISPRPKALIQSPLETCMGSATVFSDASDGMGSPATKWNWDFGDGSFSTQQNPTHTYTTTGNFTVRLWIENAVGCLSDTAIRNITVNPLPTVAFTFPATGCQGNTIQFNDSSVPNAGSISGWNWNFGDGTTDTIQNPAHRYFTNGNFNVTLNVITNKGCSNSGTKVIVISPRPKALIQSPAEACPGTSVLFTDASDGMGSPVTKWNWDFGDGSFSTQQNPTHPYTTAGNFTIRLWVENVTGCGSDTAVKNISVNLLPTVAFSSPAFDCQANTIRFTDASVPNAGSITGWNWNFGDGGTDSVQNPTHRYLTYGSLAVTLNVITDKGCSKSVTKPILIHPSPSVDFSVAANCSGSNVVFTNLSQIVNGTQSDLGFLWRFNDANSTPPNPDSSLQINPGHTFVSGGTYNISLQASSVFGCTKSIVKPITIIGKPQVKVLWQTNLCSNIKQGFADSSFVPLGIVKERSIYWDWENNAGMVVVDTTPSLGKIYQHQYAPFGGNAAKRMVIKNIALSANGCAAERYDTIVLLPSPQLVFNTVNALCINTVSFNINAAMENSGISGSGVYGGNGIDSSGIFNPGSAGIGTHRIRYTFTAANGCFDTVSNTIEVNPLPIITAGPDKVIIGGGTAVLQGSFSSNVSTVVWSPAQTLNSAVVMRPVASPVTDTWYTVTAISNKGCTSSDSVLVKVLPALKVPNVFSPNKDGINDVWNIPYLSSYIDCNMEIFDRYGRKIFSSVGYNQPWDGTFKGSDLPVGVYYYRLDIKNGKQPFNGSVTLLR